MKRNIILAAAIALAVSASAMTKAQARRYAAALTEDMSARLGLSATQYKAAYKANEAYMRAVDGRGDIRGRAWDKRDKAMKRLLGRRQYAEYSARASFSTPLVWSGGRAMLRTGAGKRHGVAKGRTFRRAPGRVATSGGHFQ